MDLWVLGHFSVKLKKLDALLLNINALDETVSIHLGTQFQIPWIPFTTKQTIKNTLTRNTENRTNTKKKILISYTKQKKKKLGSKEIVLFIFRPSSIQLLLLFVTSDIIYSSYMSCMCTCV